MRVSVNGIYDWLKWGPGRRTADNLALVAPIRRVHEASQKTYRYLRVHAELQAQVDVVGKHRMARLRR